MLTNRTLARINDRPRKINRRPLLLVGGGSLAIAALAALAYTFGVLPYSVVLAALGVGALLALLLYARQKAKMTIRLSYKGNLDDKVAARFSDVSKALNDLASSEGIWSLPDASSKRQKEGEVLPVPKRGPAGVGLLPTPGIKADVPIWGIEEGTGTLFFFPEGTLFYRNDRYVPVSYDTLKMALSSGRYFEEDLPSDATVLETVWRFSKPDGSPDPQHKNDNAEIPVVLYNLLDIRGPSGLDIRLMVSSQRAAVHFARVFGAKDLREKKRKDDGEGAASGKASPGRNGHKETPKSAEEIEREARLAKARKALGVAKGASAKEIGAAYRKLALTHHPDKVANLEPEVREYSERRMKEINAAYAELRGQGGSVARGARTV